MLVRAACKPMPLASRFLLGGLAVVLLLAACGGPRPASGPSAAGAKTEGTVAVVSNGGDWARQYFDAFQSKYGIKVDLLQVSSQAELVPKIDVERKAGMYSWDLALQPPPNLFNGLKR